MRQVTRGRTRDLLNTSLTLIPTDLAGPSGIILPQSLYTDIIIIIIWVGVVHNKYEIYLRSFSLIIMMNASRRQNLNIDRQNGNQFRYTIPVVLSAVARLTRYILEDFHDPLIATVWSNFEINLFSDGSDRKMRIGAYNTNILTEEVSKS